MSASDQPHPHIIGKHGDLVRRVLRDKRIVVQYLAPTGTWKDSSKHHQLDYDGSRDAATRLSHARDRIESATFNRIDAIRSATNVAIHADAPPTKPVRHRVYTKTHNARRKPHF